MAELTEMQKKLLNMLRFYHHFCVSNHLRYYTVGGTTLGALRHKGFIPWDDDIDVGMPRNDYEKLIKLFGDRTIDKYVLETPMSSDINYCYPFSKLYDITTTLIENRRNTVLRGIYLDIFPLDGAGNSKEQAIKHYSHIGKIKNLINLRTIKINKARSTYKNIALYIIQSLPRCILNEKRLCLDLDTICKSKDFDNSKIVGNLVGAWGTKELMPREYFGKPTLYQFEDMMVYGQERYDDYLSHLYGDWRKMPPEEKRISHHDYILDLHSSFLK